MQTVRDGLSKFEEFVKGFIDPFMAQATDKLVALAEGLNNVDKAVDNVSGDISEIRMIQYNSLVSQNPPMWTLQFQFSISDNKFGKQLTSYKQRREAWRLMMKRLNEDSAKLWSGE